MRTTAATMGRIVAQLKHDPRTVALVLVIPPVLLTLVYYIFVDVPTPPGQPGMFDRIGPIMLVILPMLMMFIVTSVVMLRERMSGTMERIFTTPLTQLSLVVSYAVVFTFLAFFQPLILGVLLFPVFDVSIEGNWGLLLLVAFLCALFGIAFGLLASAFAENEFQAVQFMPIFVGPQLLLCGLFVAPENMLRVLEVVANWLPMTWAVDVAKETLTSADISSDSWVRLGGLVAVTVVALILASASMRRSTK